MHATVEAEGEGYQSLTDNPALVGGFCAGKDLDQGQKPQVVIPRGVWQSAVSTGDWTLAGCTVAPGFDFSGFEMAVPGWAPDES